MENHNGYESASDLLARPRAASHEEKKRVYFKKSAQNDMVLRRSICWRNMIRGNMLSIICGDGRNSGPIKRWKKFSCG